MMLLISQDKHSNASKEKEIDRGDFLKMLNRDLSSSRIEAFVRKELEDHSASTTIGDPLKDHPKFSTTCEASVVYGTEDKNLLVEEHEEEFRKWLKDGSRNVYVCSI